MNILFTRFPLESAHGGAEIQTISLMKGLKERGHTIRFLGSCPVMLELCTEAGIDCAQLDIGPPPVTKWGVVSFLWKQIIMRKKLNSEFSILNSEFKYDAVVMMSLSEKLLLTPIALQQGTKVFWLEHDRIGRWLRKNPWTGRLRKLSKSVTTICVSELSKKMYIDLGFKHQHIVTIPNGIDLERFKKRERDTMHSDLVLGCVARLTKDKGVDLLIKAMPNLHNTQLHIIGDGPEKESLQHLINRLDVEDRVFLQGRHRDLGDFYQSIDALVLPSREHDPFGLVVAEAMVLGTPVLVTKMCGIANYLTEKEGIVVKHNSFKALEEGLRRFFDEKNRIKMGAKSEQLARKKFSVDSMIEAYEKLLRNLLLLFAATVVLLQNPQTHSVYYDEPIDALSVGVETDTVDLEVSALAYGKWTEWQVLEIEKEFDPTLQESNLAMFPEAVTRVRFRGTQKSYEVHPLRVTKDPASFTVAARYPRTVAPRILRRSQWGADESLLTANGTTTRSDVNSSALSSAAGSSSSERVEKCQQLHRDHPEEFSVKETVTHDRRGNKYVWAQRYSPKVKVIAVHHTALKVTGDERSAVERMRALYQYHTKNRGWGDIGYHYVIDENGQIYEGKSGGKYVVGGHAYCANVGTIGIALMGNFDKEQPTQKQMKGLQWLLDDIATQYNIDLRRKVRFRGEYLDPVVGHRTLVSTSCPGYYVWETLSQVRTNIIKGNTNAFVKFPTAKKRIIVRRSSRTTSGIQPTVTAIGSTNIVGQPGSQTRISLLFRTGKATRRRARIADVVRSDSRIGLWEDLGTDQEMRVRRELILPKDVRPGETLTLNLRLQLPRRAGVYTLRIGNASYTLTTRGKRANARQLIPLQSRNTTPPTRIQQSIVQPRPTYTRTLYPLTSASSPSIRIRLGYDQSTATVYSSRGISIEGNSGTTARVSLSIKGNTCSASANGVRLTSGIVRLHSQNDSLEISSWNKNANRFRGILECRVVDGALVLINELPLEDYIAGLAEEPDTEPYQKQRAFAIAARSYAAFYTDSSNRKFPGKPYDGDDSPARFQMYGGIVFEESNPRWVQAAEETKGLVIKNNGSIVKTPYFSSDDGRTRSPAENGWDGFPFAEVFVSKPDPWCNGMELRGHGVGMSGCGAEGQANEGKTAEEILEYYYHGTTIQKY